MLWFLPIQEYSLSLQRIISWILAALTTAVILETNNSNSLIRIRTRMVSSTWLVGIAMMTFMHDNIEANITALCTASSFLLLFKTYQEYEPVGYVFHAYFMLGIGMFFQPILIVQAVLYLWYIIIFLRSSSWRCLWAGIIGLFLPLWFILGWWMMNSDYEQIAIWTEKLDVLKPIIAENYRNLPITETVTFGFITLLSIISIKNFLSNYFNDKIRTRMLLYVYVIHTVCCWLAIVLQPHLYSILAPVLLVSSSPLIAHFFALTGSKLTNLFFCLTIIITVAVTIMNIQPTILEQLNITLPQWMHY